MSFLKEALALLAFIAVGVLIVLQVYGGVGAAPKLILGVAIVAGLFALRYVGIRGAN